MVYRKTIESADKYMATYAAKGKMCYVGIKDCCCYGAMVEYGLFVFGEAVHEYLTKGITEYVLENSVKKADCEKWENLCVAICLCNMSMGAIENPREFIK